MTARKPRKPPVRFFKLKDTQLDLPTPDELESLAEQLEAAGLAARVSGTFLTAARFLDDDADRGFVVHLFEGYANAGLLPREVAAFMTLLLEPIWEGQPAEDLISDDDLMFVLTQPHKPPRWTGPLHDALLTAFWRYAVGVGKDLNGAFGLSKGQKGRGAMVDPVIDFATAKWIHVGRALLMRDAAEAYLARRGKAPKPRFISMDALLIEMEALGAEGAPDATRPKATSKRTLERRNSRFFEAMTKERYEIA
ncbi:hypothetical protein ACQ5SO_10420 [Rhodovulum sp. DZ06]|uniref:hypothetical protein n=1 Tax=Rhodovulum sp. DZ06 TaxID=3425126 RepID=UPI003D325B2F